MQHDNPLIIIGTGLAGYHLAKEFRKLDPSRALVMITQDEGHFYSKPQLSTALMHGKTWQQLIVTPQEQMQSQLGATIYTHSHVESIDTAQQTIQVKTATETLSLSYSQLVFAMGAQCLPLPELDHIDAHFRINNLSDYARFRDANTPKHVTIIGSGLVGCEFAHDLRHADIQVSVISPEPWPLFRFVPQAVGEALKETLAAKGIDWQLGTTLSDVNQQTDSISVKLANGKTLQTDAILSAIGLSANMGLANMAGIKTEQGIVVDEYLTTNVPNVYALGDCAQINGSIRFFVAPILQCARALAQTLNANPTAVALNLTPIVLKVSAFPLNIMPPAAEKTGNWQIEQQASGIRALFVDEQEVLQGYVLSGSCLDQRPTVHQQLFKSMTATTSS